MGNRSTTIAFLVVMLVVFGIWMAFKDAGKKPAEEEALPAEETTEPPEGDAAPEAETTPEAETRPEADTEEPVIEPETPPLPPSQSMSALAVRVTDRMGHAPGALSVALVPLYGGEVLYEQLPTEDARVDDVPPGAYLVVVLTGTSPAGLIEPGAGAARYTRVMTLRPSRVETLAITVGPRVTVSGTVRDFDDRPVAAAIVTVRPRTGRGATAGLPEWLVRTATTNAAGAYQIDEVPAGGVEIQVARQGSALTSREFEAAFGAELVFHIVLPPGLPVTGAVTDLDGAPIANASVFFVAEPDRALALTTTDGTGAYVFDALPQTGLGFFALAEGYAYGDVPHRGADKDAGGAAPIVLPTEATIAGQVLFSDGSPVAGGAVHVEPVAKTDTLLLPSALATETDSAGRFTLRHLNRFTYRVVVSDPLTGQTVSEQLPAGTQEARIEIALGSSLAGRVTDEMTGGPVAGATVSAGDASATSGIDGSYELWLGPERAKVDVTASAEGYEPRTEPNLLVSGEELALNLALTPSAVAHCQLIDKKSGDPVIGAPVRWWKADEVFAQRSLRSSLDGQVVFYDAQLGDEIHLEVLDPRYVSYTTEVTLAEIDGKQIALTTGITIRGRVLNTFGEPVADADVYLGEGYLHFADPFVKRVLSDEDGRYEMPGLRERLYQMTAAHPDYLTTQSMPVDTRGHELIEGVDIVMDAGVTIMGVVVDKGNDPIPGAVVCGWGDFNYDPEQPGYRRSATTDADGRFTLGRLRRTESGSITVSASARGYATATASVTVDVYEDAPAEELVIALEPEAVLVGRAVTEEKSPIFGVRVYVRLNDLEIREVYTDGDGRFGFEGLTPGPFTLFLTRPGFLYKKMDVTVSDGPAPTEVEAVLACGAVLTGRVVNAATGRPIRIFSGQIATPDRLRSYTLHVTGDGRFTSDTVPDGTYVILIQSKDMQAATVEGITVADHLGPPGLTIELTPLPR